MNEPTQEDLELGVQNAINQIRTTGKVSYTQRESSTYAKRNARKFEVSSCCNKRVQKFKAPQKNDKGTVIAIGRCSACGGEVT